MKTLVIVCLLIFTTPLMAQNVTLAWDLSVSDSLLGAGGGYHIYQSKQSNTYTATAIATVAPGINTVTFPQHQ